MADKKYRVKCKSYDEQGRGIVHFNGSKIPVAGLIVGEMAHIQLKHTKDETIGVLCDVEIPSPERVTPACAYHEKCGACQLMHMSYKEQLALKKQIVTQLMGDLCPVEDTIGMEDPWHYRTKIHATFARNRKGKIIAGTYEEKSHRVIDIKNCMIQDEKANHIIEVIKTLMTQMKIDPYNEDKRSGILRHVLIRTGRKTGQSMVVLVIGSSYFPGKNKFIRALVEKCPDITTIVINENSKKTSMILGDKEEIVYSKGYIEDELCGVRFKISPKSFYQVNPAQTEVLYTKAIEFANLAKNDTVLDAYCGIGTISLIAAQKVKSVIGVEINRAAVKNAKANAVANHIENAEFFCEDAGQWMIKRAASKEKTPDVVFADPPRSGCSKEFLKALAKMAPEKIVYVSCNPVTLKRDALWLKEKGYQVKKVQPIDMFGCSGHVETVCLMEKKND